MKYLEGVAYHRHIVRFKLSDGRRRRRVYYSPGGPWVKAEVGRSLLEEFGPDGVAPHSCTIHQEVTR